MKVRIEIRMKMSGRRKEKEIGRAMRKYSQGDNIRWEEHTKGKM